jgi:hypothetical protein
VLTSATTARARAGRRHRARRHEGCDPPAATSRPHPGPLRLAARAGCRGRRAFRLKKLRASTDCSLLRGTVRRRARARRPGSSRSRRGAATAVDGGRASAATCQSGSGARLRCGLRASWIRDVRRDLGGDPGPSSSSASSVTARWRRRPRSPRPRLVRAPSASPRRWPASRSRGLTRRQPHRLRSRRRRSGARRISALECRSVTVAVDVIAAFGADRLERRRRSSCRELKPLVPCGG